MDEDEFYKQKAIELLAGGAATAAGIATNSPVFAGLAGLAPAAAVILRECLRRRGERLGAGYRSCDPAISEEVLAERLASKQDDPNVQDTVFETFRRLQETIDPEVAFYLGRLLWHYESSSRGPDYFFRALGRTLADLDVSHVAEMRALLNAVERANLPDQPIHLRGVEDDSGKFGVAYFRDGKARVIHEHPDPPGVFDLLKLHGLGRDGHLGMSFEATRNTLDIDRRFVGAILRVVDPGYAGSDDLPADRPTTSARYRTTES